MTRDCEMEDPGPGAPGEMTRDYEMEDFSLRSKQS